MRSEHRAIGRLRCFEAQPPATTRQRGALVLLHAFPLNARMWEGQLALAETGWRVIAPQLRGFDGGSGDPPAASVDDYAGDVIDLLDALHITQAVIGGLSMGGYVAFAMLRHAARYAQGLILADTRSQADTPEGVEGRKRMLQLVQDKGPSFVAVAWGGVSDTGSSLTSAGENPAAERRLMLPIVLGGLRRRGAVCCVTRWLAEHDGDGVGGAGGSVAVDPGFERLSWAHAA